jgi:molybdopterin converting factor small subunit
VRVEVRLYATLADHVAEARAAVPFEADLPDAATVGELIDRLRLPPEEVRLVIIDGRVVHRRENHLTDGSRVAFFPPVGGG